ncbi:DsbA family protein [Streptomyces sp. NPDC001902]
MIVTSAPGPCSPPRTATAEHWFDFICPYCYVAQDRTRILREHGIRVVGHALRIHPWTGPSGTPPGRRTDPAYALLAHEAEAAGLPLRRTDRVTHSRPALEAHEWLAASDREAAGRFAAAVFAANFADGLDIGSRELLVSLAEEAGGDAKGLRAAWGSAAMTDALAASELLAWRYGVHATPTWVSRRHGIAGLQPPQRFRDWAAALAR